MAVTVRRVVGIVLCLLAVVGLAAGSVQAATTPDFVVTAGTTSVTVPPGGVGSFTVSTAALNGFTGTVTLSGTAPSGISGVISPGRVSLTRTTKAVTSTIALAVAGSTAPGTYTVTITGASGALSHGVSVQVLVPGLAAAATPTSLSVTAGQSGTVALTVTAVAGFTGTTALTATGLPTGVTAAFAPASGALTRTATSFASTVTFTVAGTASAGTSSVTLRATSGSTVATTVVALTVARPAALTVSGSPVSAVVPPGTAASYAIALGRANVNGSVALTASGLPANTTAVFSPSSTTGTTSTLTVTPSAGVPEGRYPFTVRAAIGVVSATTTLTLVVEKKGLPFTISGPVAPLTLLAPGVTAPLNLTITNPSTTALNVSALTVAIVSSDVAGCSPSTNYTVQQFSGSFAALVVPAGTSRTLQQLGVPASAWPKVTMLNLPTNQDVCKGATLTLSFSGNGNGGVTA